MKSVITLLSCLAFLAVCDLCLAQLMSCPTAEDLAPCTCKGTGYGVTVLCANLTETSDLTKALKALIGYRVQYMDLHSLNLEDDLPSDIFEGLEVSQLRIVNSKFQLPEPVFGGLENSLKFITLVNSTPSNSPIDIPLARLSKLTMLIVSLTPLNKVRNEWLNGKIPNVEYILLDNNLIDEVENNAFQSLTKIVGLYMANNEIETVSRSMLPRPATALKRIDLSQNKIQSLPDDLFSDMPNLEIVRFPENNLQTVSEKTWSSVWGQLTNVELGSELVCDEQLNWLKNVRWPERVVGSCASPSSLRRKTLEEVYKS